MEKREYNTDRFANTDIQQIEVLKWKGRYNMLIATLGKLGSQVRVSRVLENDHDIPPYSFVRNAFHEFVFPPQEVSVAEDKSRVIDPTAGYAMRQEQTTWTYDEDKVEGRIRVHYDDADSRISFDITDLMNESVLPSGVLTAIDEAELLEPVE